MAFLAVLKEGFETAVFLLATFSAATSAWLAATGALLAIASALVFSFYSVVGKKRTPRFGGIAVTCFSFLFGSTELLVILLLGLCSLFWHTSITGMVVLLVLTYALEIVVDNVCARMTWGWMLKHAFGITLGLAIFNILWLYVR